MSDTITPRLRIKATQPPKVRLRVVPALLPMQIELQNTGTMIQWRYAGQDWEDLIAIADLDTTVTVGSVTTLAPGSPATVVNVGTPQDMVLNFGIPAGLDGADGADGVIASIVAGAGISVDNTDPANPVVTVDAVASEIPFTPTGGIAATNVQTAIAELDTEKLSTPAAAAAYQPLDADLTAIAALADPNADRVLFWDDSAGAYAYLSLAPNLVISGTELRVLELWGGAVSDETTAITTGTGKLSFSIPYNFAVVGVYATLNTASSSGTPTFDINEGGTTILSTKIVIDANELTGGSSGYQGTAAGAAVISDAAIAAFAQVTVDIDTAGTGAKGAKVFIVGYRTA